MELDLYKDILEILKDEIVLALGCTESVAVALASARGREVLGREPEQISLEVSRNIFKNGVGVEVPETGMVGLEIAASLGAMGGNPGNGLQVLKNVNKQALTKAKLFANDKKVSVSIKDNKDKVYIKSILKSGNSTAKVVIRGRHSNITLVELNEEILFQKETGISEAEKELKVDINVIYDFIKIAEYEDIKFVLDLARVNSAIAREGLDGNYGLNVGKRILSNVDKGFLNDDILTHTLVLTAAASDARMGGCRYPAASNSGSGNQGITAMLPVISVAEKLNQGEEKLTRALVLSNLIAIYIKKKLGQLSALCGCVVAATGASCGITYLLGGDLNNISHAIKNMVSNISGMVCDGAKAGCAFKVATGAGVAYLSALLAMDDIQLPEKNGIVDEKVEKTIDNLALLGSKGMEETDELITKLML